MADPIKIKLTFVQPIMLKLRQEPVYHIGTAQAGPRGEKGEPGVSDVPDASETEKGIIQLATQQEVTAGENSEKAVVPSTLKNEIDVGDVYLVFENSLI